MTHYLVTAFEVVAGAWLVMAPLSWWLNRNLALSHAMAVVAVCMALAKLAALGACRHWNLDPTYAMCFLPQ